MKGFQPVIKFAQGAGKLLGKIFLPITIVMTLIDVVKGMFAGYEDDGWLGAIEGGLTGLINSIIGMPLDLLKKAVSWMLGMFGFDNASAALDSFSFSDLISDAIGGIFDFGKKAFEWFGQLFTDLLVHYKTYGQVLLVKVGLLTLSPHHIIWQSIGY